MVYFQGRPAHTCSSWSIFRGDQPTHTQSIFMGDLPSHSHWSIFTGDLPTNVHPGLFSRATGPHTHTVYFHGRPAHILTLVFLSFFLSSFFFLENFLMVGFFSFVFSFQGHNMILFYYQLNDFFFSLFFSFFFVFFLYFFLGFSCNK